ncbi:MAG: MFS transporter [Planctomycetota bacterium]
MAVSERLTDAEKIRRLPWLIAASLCTNIFVVLTFIGSIFVLFLNELGLDKSRIGIVLSLVPFCQIIGLFTSSLGVRFGFKRIFLVFYSIRKVVIMFILLTPLVVQHYGLEGAYWWVVGIILVFSLTRSVAESASLPWMQEIVPNNIRGKFSAINSIVSTIGIIFAVAIGGYVISHFTGLGRFVSLMAGGISVGMVSVLLYSHLPAGSPVHHSQREHVGLTAVVKSLGDPNYRRFLVGMGLAIVALGAMFSFVPLFLKEQIGIQAGHVVWIDMGALIGSGLFCYLWGWACDRYGSKPVMITSLCLVILLPISWFLMPRNSPYSGYFALVVSFILGIANIGWVFSFSQYLFVTAVPVEKKAAYMSVFFSLTGLLAGAAPLFAGQLLEVCRPINAGFAFFHFDPYTPLFAIGFGLLICAIYVISTLAPDGAISTPEFVGMIFQGNPIMGVSNIMRYSRAGDEADRIKVTERMGDAKTLLNLEELVEALEDPSFNVRHEAITAISKLPSHPKLVDALVMVLGGNQPDLSLTAASALGRLGDKSAIIALRETLLSEYSLLQARSARALAMLGDTASIDFMMNKLMEEPDEGLKIAYASALGALHAGEALEGILSLLHTVEDKSSRNELALAVARIIGAEHYYVRLLRRFRKDPATVSAQMVRSFKQRLVLPRSDVQMFQRRMEDCSGYFAACKWEEGLEMLCTVGGEILQGISPNLPAAGVLDECIQRLCEFGSSRDEYIVLILHALRLILRVKQSRGDIDPG